MAKKSFQTVGGLTVSAVTTEEMRAVDRVAVDEVGLGLLQMMENAARILARHVRQVREEDNPVQIVVGNGGNGGGGMACARHLANRDVPVEVVVDRSRAELSGATAKQFQILEAMAIPISTGPAAVSSRDTRGVIVDALIGYGIAGPVRSPAAEIIETVNEHPSPIVSLDIPSGIDATTGEVLGQAVVPNRTVTLALPKTGLDTVSGRIFLADIGIPHTVYDRLELEYSDPFVENDWVALV